MNRRVNPNAVDPPRLFVGRVRQKIFAEIWDNPGINSREIATAIYGSDIAKRKHVAVHIVAIAQVLRLNTPWELHHTPVRVKHPGRPIAQYKIIKRKNHHASPVITPSLP